ncbi:MAG: aminotransferase class V-fold PLP-dependent enzyme [Planctomycetes bacterium]|nr:aminotransferase class V-fold PLP-dependent enzyme [Planctomycetota bacterium]
MNCQRIYLDNAATSWPKPETVYDAVDYSMRTLGATAGRSVYREAEEVERRVAQTRTQLAKLLGTTDPTRIIFTANGTESLNLAIHGTVRAGDHVITSVVDHNSVLRPLRFLEDRRLIEVDRVACDARGFVDPDAIRRAIRTNTRLIVLVHASNVTGALQPIEEVGRLAREHELLYLVDAAQSLGHMPFDVRAVGAHMVAAPAHKGLLGPSGLGILYVAPGCESQLNPLRQGGTGTQSDIDRQPDSLPDKYEPGNLNVPAVLGLGAAVEFLAQRGLESVRQHARALTGQLLDGFASVDGVTLYGPRDPQRQLGVVSINVRGADPREVASMLDAAHYVQVRAGIHCAPLMHQALKTTGLGGSVRFSLSVFTSPEEVDAAVAAVREIVHAGAGA